MEIEFKLSCTPEAAQGLSRQLTRLTGAGPSRMHLQNTYYDTPNQDLRAQGIALRIRQQGKTALQTVKCAGLVSGGLSSRPEWETTYNGRFDFSPVSDPKVREQLETLMQLPGYRATLDTNFSRHIWHWRPAADTHVEIALDRGRILAGGREEAICEIELELIEGTPERLLDLVAHLATLAPLFPAPLSKASRGSLLLGASVKSALPQDTRAGNCSDIFITLAQHCLDQISINLPVNCSRFSAENLHQVRTGLRRLRALLQLFQPLLRRAWPHKPISAGARHYMATLAPARDLYVLQNEIVTPALSTIAPRKRQPLQTQLARMSEAALADAERHLLSAEFSTWLLHTSLALHTRPLRRKAAGQTWARQSAKLLAPRLADYDKHLRRTKESPEAMHLLRKSGKHLRYQLAVSEPDHVPRQLAAIGHLAKLQDTLGSLNDLYSAAHYLGHLPLSYTATITAIGAHHVDRHKALQKQATNQIRRLRPEIRTLRAAYRKTST
jgi:adenylate cyclase